MRKSAILMALATIHITVAAPVTVIQTVTAVTNADGSFYDPSLTATAATAIATAATTATSAETAEATTTSGSLWTKVKEALTLLADESSDSSTDSSSLGGWKSLLLKLFGDSSSESTASAASAAPTTAASASVLLVATSSSTAATSTSTGQNLLAALAGTSTSTSAELLPLSLSSSGDIYSAIYDSSEEIDEAFAKAILDSHNKYRALHGSGELSWASGPYKYAKNNADNYDCSGILTHTHGQYGENLAAGYSSGPSAVQAWYDEGETYNYNVHNTYDHFTQVVWKASTQVGCAYKDCSSTGWGKYIVCEYNPVGNVVGQNQQNVLPLE